MTQPEGTKKRAQGDSYSAANIKQGVTVAWLAAVFERSPEWVRLRLVSCPPLSQHGRSFRYSIAVAAPYLVDPVFDLEAHLKQLKPNDLPAGLQKDVWDARLKRQKWEEQAGDLWRTDDVLAVLSSTFSTIKTTIQLWPDTVERQHGLTEDQRELLIYLADNLQDELHQKLMAASEGRRTRASIAEFEGESATEADPAVEAVL